VAVETSELNAFSRKVAERLFERFPEWRPFARAEESGDERGILYVEVPPPSGANLENPLHILTANEEVEVGFDFYHNHFELLLDIGEMVQQALEFILDILEERVVAVSWWSGASLRGASSEKSGLQPEASEHVHPYDRIRIRSWRGRYDQDVHT
jgi:hypothetical protein